MTEAWDFPMDTLRPVPQTPVSSVLRVPLKWSQRLSLEHAANRLMHCFFSPSADRSS